MNSFTHHADVTVIGGGLAGVSAAIAAARDGAKVALIGNRPVLGGNSSSEIRVWVVGATAHGAQKFARETGIMGELFLENQWRNPEGNPILWDHVVLDMVRAEENITLFLNTDVREVDATGPDDDRVISAVTGWQMGSENTIRYESPVFVDCTGDGLVGLLAGARYMKGREAQSEHSETLAPIVADDNMLGSTILLYTKDAGEPVVFVPPNIAKDISMTSIPLRRHIDTSMNGCDFWWIEWGGELDAVDDNEAIRDELWGVVFGIWDHIKNSGEFDADTLTLEWVGSIPGKREYRRFLGDHVLTENDIIEQTRFPDAVGFGGWSIDLHPPGGIYADEGPSAHVFGPGLYEIPFRSLYSVNVSNLLMAGRDISASHVAFGTTRVMATCAVTGEAAGIGAAFVARTGSTPREIARTRMNELQQQMLRVDASLLGVPWTDATDLALTASATSSQSVERLTANAPVAGGDLIDLDAGDVGLLLPVDPWLESITLEVESRGPAELEWELWSTGNGLTHIPLEFISRGVMHVASDGRHSVTARVSHFPHEPHAAVLVLRSVPNVSLVIAREPAPYGVMTLTRRDPRYPHGSAQSNAWSAFELRGRSIAFSTEPSTRAYSPEQVIGGYQRPYGGPRMWAAAMSGDAAWVELRWQTPVHLGSIELVFNDDVDEDLINLHRHRTPFRVMPTLVRDYRVEYLSGDEWRTLDEVTSNRQRHRTHRFAHPVTADRVRVVVHATNGHSHAMISALRAFAPTE